VPSYSFISDTNTGIYLAGANILGLTANGVSMMLLNNSSPLTPQISTPAEFTALNGIKGGTF
jgi:hypothetical protein